MEHRAASHPGGESPEFGGAREPLVELLPILKRYWRLISVVTACTIGLGVLHYFKTPPTYESRCQVLLKSEDKPAFSIETLHQLGATEQTNIETHSFIISSRMIVSRALKSLGGPQALPSLREVDDTVSYVIDNLHVDVVGDSTSIVTLSYRGSEQADCKKIVDALVDEYRSFLGEDGENSDQKAISLISKAKDELLEKLTADEQEYNEFRRTVPLLWEDGKGINPHLARQVEVERARSELLLQKSAMAGKLKTMVVALTTDPAIRSALRFEARRELLGEAGMTRSDLRMDEDEVIDTETARRLASDYMELTSRRAELTNQFGKGHPDVASINKRIKSLKRRIDATRANAGSRIDTASDDNVDYVSLYMQSLQEQLKMIDQQMSELDQVCNREQNSAHEMQDFLVQDEAWRHKIQRTQGLFDAVVARLGEVEIVGDHAAATMNILSESELGKRVAPTLLRHLAASGVLGLLFGFGLATLLDKTSATFHGPNEIRQELNTPLIGRVPAFVARDMRIPERYQEVSKKLCALNKRSLAAEAYRTIRTSLYFSGRGKENKVIQVTSATPGDGKSTLIANLAITLAQSGKRVLIADADFRKPTQHRLFGKASGMQGLSDVIVGACDPDDAIQQTEIEGVSLMTAGTHLKNPSEMLTAPEFSFLIDVLKETYDYVLFDTPPVLAVTDPCAVAARVDAVIVAVRLRRGVRVAARRAVEMLEDVGANMVGAVVNAIQVGSPFGKRAYGYGNGYGGKYGYGYGHDQELPEPVNAEVVSPRQLEVAKK